MQKKQQSDKFVSNFVPFTFQPVKNYNQWMLVYFLSFVVLGYFLLDMFIGVMVETFNHCQQKQRTEKAERPQTGPPALNDGKRTDGLEGPPAPKIITFNIEVCVSELQEPEFSSYCPLRRMIILACRSRILEITMTAIVVINVVLMGVEHHNQPKVTHQHTPSIAPALNFLQASIL